MHLYTLVRGIKHDVDKMITELQGKYLPIRATAKDGSVMDFQVQLSVRPIMLYEFAFPKEAKDIVCTTILGESAAIEKKDKSMSKWVFILRKLLRAKPIGNYDSKNKMPNYKDNINVVGVGIRDDKPTSFVIDGKEYFTEGI